MGIRQLCVQVLALLFPSLETQLGLKQNGKSSPEIGLLAKNGFYISKWLKKKSEEKYYVIRDRKKKAMATHSSTLAWKIPWMEEPGRLQSMGSLRVRHN